MFRRLREDVATVFSRDPAARSVLEVLICYPGLHAIWLHRISHWLWRHRIRLLSRLTSHLGRFLTGIEIHPGATMGKRFFIDHGMGVVIGETAEIGDDVLFYQGVVLGGTSLEKKKRHPTLGNGVIVGTGAILLGPIKIGNGVKVGAGSVVLNDVARGSIVVGVPARATSAPRIGQDTDLDHARLPDPVANAISLALTEQDELKERLRKLEELEGMVVNMDRRNEDRHAALLRTFAPGAQEDFNSGSGI